MRPSSSRAWVQDRHLIVDLLGNLVVFIPLGFSVSGLFYRPRRTLLAIVAPAILGGAGMSLFVESIQLSMPTRAGDVTDVIWNSLGAVIGGWILFSLQKRVASRINN